MPTPIIQARQLSFNFSNDDVLSDVDFKIQEGEFVGIIGPNGSGKTTLLRLMLGLLQTQKGEILLFGEKAKVGKNAKKIGYIPQKVTQFETRFPITVEEVVRLGRTNQKGFFQKLNKFDEKIVTDALKTVDLIPYRHRLISELSGGLQQRAFIAKALAGEPKLLILDEPTVGIDIDSQEKFYELLTKLNKEHHLTIVLVSHDIDVVLNEVSSVLCLNKTLIYHGNPKTFLKEEYIEKLYGKNRKLVIHNH